VPDRPFRQRRTTYSGTVLRMTSALRPALVVGTVGVCALTGCARPAPRSLAPSSESAPAPGPSAPSGTYTFFSDGTRMTVNGEPRAGGLPSSTTWRITPCGTGCATVTSSLNWTTELRLTQNTWTATRTLDINCGHAPSTITYSLNADTLTGTATNTIPCDNPPSVVVLPARLTKD
jgi:hypothetical protein